MTKSRTGRQRPDGPQTPKGVIRKRARRKFEQKRRFKKWYSDKSANEGIQSEFTKSKLLDSLFPQRRSLFLDRSACRHIRSEVNLNGFSFLDNPIGTLNMLEDIVRANSTSAHNSIHFLDPICWDMAPYMVFNLIEKDLDSTRIKGGHITPFVKKILRETDFLRHLNMTTSTTDEDLLEIWPVKLMCCKQSNAEAFRDYVAPHGDVADKFTKEIENWLKESGFELNETGSSTAVGLLALIWNVVNADKLTKLSKTNEFKGYALDAFESYAAEPIRDAIKTIDELLNSVAEILHKKTGPDDLKAKIKTIMEDQALSSIHRAYRLCSEADGYLKGRGITTSFEKEMYYASEGLGLDDMVITNLADALNPTQPQIAIESKLRIIEKFFTTKKITLRTMLTEAAERIARKYDRNPNRGISGGTE